MFLGAGGGPPAGRQGFVPAGERTEVKCRFPSRGAGEAARPSPPPGALEKGVCMKVETLNKCCGKFPHFYSESNELSFFQPCVQVAVLSLAVHVNIENSLSFPVICLLDTPGTPVCGLK